MSTDSRSTEPPEHPNPWEADIRRRFPQWGTEEAVEAWPSARAQLAVGQSVEGEVVARAPFGVWLDIGSSSPALLLVPMMENPGGGPIAFEDYPAIGGKVSGRINALGQNCEISITQKSPDPMIDPEDKEGPGPGVGS